jgi:hypothetical protein
MTVVSGNIRINVDQPKLQDKVRGDRQYNSHHRGDGHRKVAPKVVRQFPARGRVESHAHLMNVRPHVPLLARRLRRR